MKHNSKQIKGIVSEVIRCPAETATTTFHPVGLGYGFPNIITLKAKVSK